MPPMRYQSLSLDDSIAKLYETVEIIKLREAVKPHEDKRIQGAFAFTEQRKPSSSKTSERWENYRRFLKKINDDCGPQLVLICAVSLGQTAIAGMKEHNRLRLPLEVKKHEHALKSPIIQKLAEEYFPSTVDAATESERSISWGSQQTGLQQPTETHQSILRDASSSSTQGLPLGEHTLQPTGAELLEGHGQQQVQEHQTGT
ncbi:hypothetical protein FQN54_008090 [Arachnomyces sp. PD_36]|nr:hypothetical protein FQN54_008090 [Arachnomyces sp. PD_36]